MAFTGALGTFTPYSSVLPLVDASMNPAWAPPGDQDRIASYHKYEEMYWNNPTTFRLQQRGIDINPLYVPNGRTVVDSTAHFLMKSFSLMLGNERDQALLDKWLKREQFYHKFHVGKHSGVVRGDYILHLTADPQKPSGRRISVDSVDPGSYFPIYSDEHPDDITGVDIVDVFTANDGRPRVLRQRYTLVVVGGSQRVTTELLLLKEKDWWDDDKSEIIEVLIPEKLLPVGISVIPVYHLQNIGWQGQPFGSSELRGMERLMGSVNQSASDEEVALALEGLGVYATDAPHPTDSGGTEIPWDISPGRVLEYPTGSKFERVTGVGSIKPMQDHIEYLEGSLYESTGTFRPAHVDIQVAQSGIALAIKFLPTMAKIDQREEAAKAVLQQLFFDWGSWQLVYENQVFSTREVEVDIALGEKLPKDPTDVLNELNNMYDRGIISSEYYREQMTEQFGYDFPDNIADQVVSEKKAAFQLQAEFGPPPPTAGPTDQSGTKNKSNNNGKPNESGGTEAK